MTGCVDQLLNIEFDDLDLITYNSADVENTVQKYSSLMKNIVNKLIHDNYAHLGAPNEVIDKMFDMICKAWAVPNCKLAYALCNTLRESGGLDLLINNCVSRDQKLQFSSSRLLEQCLTTENREYVLENGVENVVHVVCEYKTQISSVDKLNVSTGEIYFFLILT